MNNFVKMIELHVSRCCICGGITGRFMSNSKHLGGFCINYGDYNKLSVCNKCRILHFNSSLIQLTQENIGDYIGDRIYYYRDDVKKCDNIPRNASALKETDERDIKIKHTQYMGSPADDETINLWFQTLEQS